MKRISHALGLLGAVLVSAPASILATFALSPFWSWLEAATGIESLGHSGPAEWCYAAVFALFAGSAALLMLGRRRAGTPSVR